MIQSNNRMIHELDETSPHADVPNACNIILKAHQLTALHKCLSIEKNPIKINDRESLKTTVGIIGDSVGAGKSYVVLAIISNPITLCPELYKSFGGNRLTTVYQTDSADYIDTCIIVIPHNLCNQWETYISNFNPLFKILVIKTAKVAFKDNDFSKFDIILITCSQYNKFATLEHARAVKFSRIFFDEADNVNIAIYAPVEAAFIWFITASSENMIFYDGHFTFNDAIGRYVEHARGLKTNGFVKEIFSNVQRALTEFIVVKNNDEFVKRSLQLPEVQNHVLKCKTSKILGVLNNMVDKSVMTCLHANDVKKAIQFLEPGKRTS
jgi:hypothetical protein